MFTKAIVEATGDLVVAYKPNSAFYEQFGPPGMDALRDTIEHIHAVVPNAVVILDAKRGDIEHTNEAYATALFDVYDADAVTVQPYLGAEPLAPFMDRLDRGVIVLCRTSNPGGGEIQDLTVEAVPLYQHVASIVETSWNRNSNCGLLVGATYPDEIRRVRVAAPSLPLLIAGVGRQHGALRDAVTAGATTTGSIIVSASRSVTHASVGRDFAEAARIATLALHDEVINHLAADAT
jgi:orotidine-5'-phosphate decarboxylase